MTHPLDAAHAGAHQALVRTHPCTCDRDHAGNRHIDPDCHGCAIAPDLDDIVDAAITAAAVDLPRWEDIHRVLDVALHLDNDVEEVTRATEAVVRLLTDGPDAAIHEARRTREDLT